MPRRSVREESSLSPASLLRGVRRLQEALRKEPLSAREQDILASMVHETKLLQRVLGGQTPGS